MKGPLGLSSSVLIAAASAPAAVPAANMADLHFFVGRTESVSVTKVVMERPFVTRSVGLGRIDADGSLELVQHVKEQGRREFDRRWQIRQVAPERFAGTMSEAEGPVSIDKIADRYRFRFVMKGNLSVEQWLTPERDMTTAHIELTIRKYGFAVAHGNGWIRRADALQLHRNASLRAGS